MKLRRRRADRAFRAIIGLLLVTGATVTALLSFRTALRDWDLFSQLALAFWLVLFFVIGIRMIRPAGGGFAVDIDADGWSLRLPSLERRLRWGQIVAVVVADVPSSGGPRNAAPETRLFLVPADAVGLGDATTVPSPLDGTPALDLCRLDEVADDEDRFVDQLAVLTGDRLHDLRNAQPPAGALRLSEFPAGSDLARWHLRLDRRKAVVFTGWYLLVLLPVLVLVVLATQWHQALGFVALMLGGAALIFGFFAAMDLYGDGRSLSDRAARVDGSTLRVTSERRGESVDLHSGTTLVLPPGTLKGTGRAWVLAHRGPKGNPIPDLLLTDPRTGCPRQRADLTALTEALRTSPHEPDRVASRDLADLATRTSSTDEPSPPWPAHSRARLAYDLWRTVKGLIRIVPLALVVATVAMAGAWVLESGPFVAYAILIGATLLFTVWLCYALYRVHAFVIRLIWTVAQAFR
ncbi:hypothetical protein DFJ67_5682 [Asanoa ferruginea]|uniref:Uncharacterized protein n=1 Tax=Asanoa ferruginea TaxID=53367 RepID=A0A3D9ZT65_9ACTN|nr:hypothetical protein [Asanoa ferruginea]REF99642.1 hypothetical protein DFJ67_5682 [Asanoa ferruginea]GIF52101.1 hypothetical protein Afe04nite_66400 [Asanoa ferruginea]